MRRWKDFAWALGPLLVALLVTCLSSCSAGERRQPLLPGKALPVSAATQVGITDSPPGQEWGFQFAYLRNLADSPITLIRASVTGQGIGTVVRVASIEVAPLPNVDARYVTYPPAYKTHDGCWVDRLFDVHGYEMQPGDEVRLLVLMRNVTPGRYKVDGHTIVYRQGGKTYTQFEPVGPYGQVRTSANPLRPYPEERACLGAGVRLLPGAPGASGM